MKKSKYSYFSIFVFLFISVLPVTAYSANHYIRSGASGANSGVDWTNALTSLPPSLVRGDTYYIADGSYSGYEFDDPASGTTYITIKKATTDDHGTEAGWRAEYGDGVATFSNTIRFRSSYWIFDGVKGQGDGSTEAHGFKIDLSWLTTQTRITCIRIQEDSLSHVTVRHVAMIHAGGLGSTQDGRDIVYVNPGSGGANFLTFSNCYLYNAGRCPFLFRLTFDSVIEHCYIRKNESTSADHAEGISAIHSTFARNTVRNNIWDDTEGTGVLSISGDSWEVYGNLMFNCSSNDAAIGTQRGMPDNFSLTNTKIYNNTIVNGTGYNSGTAFFDTDTGNEVYNNIWYNCANLYFRGGQTRDYNLFDDDTHGESNAQVWTQGSSLFVNYNNNDFRLATPTEHGTALGSPYNVDMRGNLRGSDGTWDRGAYEFVGGGASPTTVPTTTTTIPPEVPEPPTGLEIIIE